MDDCDAKAEAEFQDYARDQMAETLDDLRGEVALLKALIRDLVDKEDPCYFDHHDYCQAHGWMTTERTCPHGRAKRMGI